MTAHCIHAGCDSVMSLFAYELKVAGVRVCVCVCVLVCVLVCLCARVFVCVCVSVYVCGWVCVHAHTHVCLHLAVIAEKEKTLGEYHQSDNTRVPSEMLSLMRIDSVYAALFSKVEILKSCSVDTEI